MDTTHFGESKSCWNVGMEMPHFPRLTQDTQASVCVVGGGIAGLTTAYLLLKEGKSVCLLEAFELGSGQTGKTTAQFSNVLDDRFTELEKYHGVENVKLAVQSYQAALRYVEKIISDEKISCESQRVGGYLFSLEESGLTTLKKELAAAHRAGLTDAHLVDRAPIDSFDTGTCIHFPRQLQLHPLKYLKGMAEAIDGSGGKIFCKSPVVSVKGGANAYVETKNGHKVFCDSIVIATNSPINNIFALHTKQSAYRTYVVAFKIPAGTVPHGMYWDTLDPYHYIRVESDTHGNSKYELLIVGGEDHKTGQDDKPEARYQTLEKWTRDKFPMAEEVLYRWSGQVMEPVDGLGYLGHNPLDRNNVYVITGDSGDGMTQATVGGLIITDQIMKRKNAWENIYSPSRISLRATGEFLKENFNVAAQYGDWFKTPNGEPDDLEPGQGAIFGSGINKVAAYREESGELHLMSAICPHLAGVVAWNSAEKSWDCPCHGSRFDCKGKVIEGPAFKDLERIDDGDSAEARYVLVPSYEQENPSRMEPRP